jgi:signal transduction histidine kinase
VSVLYAWLRRHPVLVDGVLAFVLLLLGIGSLIGDPLVRLPFTLLMVVPVAFRRRNPVLAFSVAVAGGAGEVLAGGRPSGSDLAIVVLLYTLAAYRPRRESVTGLAVCLTGSAFAVVAWMPGGNRWLQQFLAAGVIFGGAALIAWVLGDSMRYRRAYYLALEDRAARLERERDAQAQIAAAAERARIARELHDVVAHNVSVMVVQADGASYALGSEPERARQALATIAATGRQALAEMRRLLGVLRSGDFRAELAPLPGVDQLRDLLDQTRAAGRTVSFMLDGTPRPLPDGVGLAAYRVVQESLTNSRKHGGIGASVAVSLRYSADELLVQVTDDGRGAAAANDGAGLGLTGMRERVGIYGGSVQAGPRQLGGYQVTARLPLHPGTGAADGAVAAEGSVRLGPLRLEGSVRLEGSARLEAPPV